RRTPPEFVVRRVSGERRVGGQAAAEPDAQGQPLAAAGPDGSRLGSEPHEGQLLRSAVSPAGGATRQEAGVSGGRTFVASDHLPCSEGAGGVPRPRSGLFRPAGTGALAALPGQTLARPRLRGDAVSEKTQR